LAHVTGVGARNDTEKRRVGDREVASHYGPLGVEVAELNCSAVDGNILVKLGPLGDQRSLDRDGAWNLDPNQPTRRAGRHIQVAGDRRWNDDRAAACGGACAENRRCQNAKQCSYRGSETRKITLNPQRHFPPKFMLTIEWRPR